MTRLNILLLLVLVLSALALVHSQYESRRLFMAGEAARKEAARLEIERDRLLVERHAQATPLRVERLAKQQLQMRMVTPGITQYVNAPTAAAAIQPPGGKP